jgi:hypothetical protein
VAIAALITAVLVGAAVGGGIGVSLKHCDGSQSQACVSHKTCALHYNLRSHTDQDLFRDTHQPPSRTVTLTTPASANTNVAGLLVNYSVAAPSMIANVAFNCKEVDQTLFSSSTGVGFLISCPQTYYHADLVSLIAYTIHDCIEACSALNFWQDKPGYCSRVAWTSYMGMNHGSHPRTNCWLKTNESESDVADESEYSASARLIAG